MAQIDGGLLRAALNGLEFERLRIEAAIAEIQAELAGSDFGRPTKRVTDKAEKTSPKKHVMSAEGKRRIAAAQRKRWSLRKAAQSKPAKVKRRLSAAGRARIIEATKKRWAAYRKAVKTTE